MMVSTKIYIQTIFIVSLACYSSFTWAQQISPFNLYNQNTFLINPAVAGLNHCLYGFVNRSVQTTGVDQAPSVQQLSLYGSIAPSHGLGTAIRYSDLGLVSQFSGNISYAYHLKISQESALHAAFSLGIDQQRLNMNEVIASDYTDELLIKYSQPQSSLSNGLGLMFTSQKLTLGIAVPQTFSRKSEVNFVQNERINAYASYGLVNTPQWQLEGFLLYRNYASETDRLDIGSRVVLKDILGLGAIYKTGRGVAVMADLQINDQFIFAYNYEVATKSQSLGGSHGLMLGIRLCHNKNKSVDRQLYVQSIPSTPMAQPAPPKPTLITPIKIETAPYEEKTLPDSLNSIFKQKDLIIRFAQASPDSVVSGNQHAVVSKVAGILKAHPELKVTIIGHASSSGTEEFNQQISEARAKAVANILIKEAIDTNRISTIGRGELAPLSEQDEENRCVQVVFHIN
ncbi:PorP/SprF family type IX secretion system membrane protein [Reichenbachiella carrageenanivorans]|uniref:PorP/SprF family type IX secretion system membrane protein n=1 Tax=Reichenbachiella carrageenanivorans TaxID=2979869 RepID=A0ABY6D283_9BACT|nr:PorP/SprF family type IX secretion system membrane protein [Reichenbachiella carrageenanivorans]UXX79203.1 PorP/SprF family type IX secretion system membrane protein [Reichenbachiella carrageenanivorans]